MSVETGMMRMMRMVMMWMMVIMMKNLTGKWRIAASSSSLGDSTLLAKDKAGHHHCQGQQDDHQHYHPQNHDDQNDYNHHYHFDDCDDLTRHGWM